MVSGGWFVATAFGTTAGTLGLIRYLWTHREEPGADWFLAALSCQALWALLYGTGLLVFDPLVRWVLEVVSLAALIGLTVFFLAFSLEYTGQGEVRSLPRVGAVVLAPLVTLAVAATNPVHRLFWTGYGIDPVWGLATVDYAFQPLALAVGTVALFLPILGSLLLFDTVVSYGPLYRREAAAVGLSPLPPIVGLAIWFYGLGSLPQVNFAAALFLPHVALDAYAFLGSDMFEFHPATRRAGERAAIDDLGSPVVVVDDAGRIVTTNPAGETVLGVDKRDALGDPLEAHLDGETVDPAGGTRRIAVAVDGTRRTFSVRSTELSDARGRSVGYTLVWGDVTDEIRREQRLTVLNRVLRHNLRNDLGVVEGFVSAARDRVDDGEVVGLLDRALDGTDDLVELGETARDVERVLDGEPVPEPVDLAELLPELAAEVRDLVPSATVELDPAPATVTADRETLRAVVLELLENAAIHGGTAPTVAVSVHERDDAVEVRVEDDGPGIPDAELAVLDDGTETQLEHGSGLGLWLATWGTGRLNGDLSFESGEDGTTARLSLPRHSGGSTTNSDPETGN